jgi:muramoyltetrapeptide carboxypeptidase
VHDGVRFCLIWPSSGLTPDEADALLKTVGTRFRSCITGSSEAQVFASEYKKFTWLNEALLSDVLVVWAIRGGYGVDRLMLRVSLADYSRVPKKVIVGYSDITPLLIHMSQKYGWTAVSGSCFREVALGTKSPKSTKALMDFLKGRTPVLKIDDLTPMNAEARAAKELRGKTTGGNVTCIVSTIGTPWFINTYGKIIFLEDTNVEGYRLDRLLVHMRNAMLFNGVVAVILGDFGGNVGRVLQNFAGQLKIPVYKSSLFGHGKTNMPFGYEFDGTITKGGGGRYVVSMKR